MPKEEACVNETLVKHLQFKIMTDKNMKIGFIGQGWIGKNYADDFEERGFITVRYSLEEPFIQNKSEIEKCDITFIAVPTPTTPAGFDDSYLRSALQNIGAGKIAVIKSTTLPGVTTKLQQDHPNIILLHSPEFLTERTAAYDARNPNRNIVGYPLDTKEHQEAAQQVLKVLPEAPYQTTMSSLESELVKYAGNCFLYTKVLFMNTLYDLVQNSGGDFRVVREALINDPRIGESHTEPVHKSGHVNDDDQPKRGAGGHCFIKDFEAYRNFYQSIMGEAEGYQMLTAMTDYNNNLLINSKKDLDLLSEVFGAGTINNSDT